MGGGFRKNIDQNDACNDQDDPHNAGPVQCLAPDDDARDDGEHQPHARPDGVGNADGEDLQTQRQQIKR